MKNKIFVAAVLVVSVGVLAGCADITNKFIRKKKEEPKRQKYYAVHEYDVRPSMELYSKRYSYWSVWQTEMLQVIRNPNEKKIKVAVEQGRSNLMDLEKMIVDEKVEKMKKMVDDLIKIEKQIKQEGITSGNEVRIRKVIEAMGREVKRDYSPTKMRRYLREEFAERPDLREDLPEGATKEDVKGE
ncbi:MAG TPA: hypothetical protein PKY78_04900 [Candidatus Omnitrophota bacterium]|nr:hypothetical protein [Candidatus Omnitrophota bacterium]